MRTVVSMLALVGLVACSESKTAAPAPAQAAPVPMVAQGPLVQMSVTSEGFVPAQIKAKAGEPLKLTITRKTEKTCATEIVIKEYNINKPLPLNQPVDVELTPQKPGAIRFACAMDMIAGSITVE